MSYNRASWSWRCPASPQRPWRQPCARVRGRPSPLSTSPDSPRWRALVRLGNAGARSPYKSRCEADFAVYLAMFGAGYEEAEVWAVMADPANGISERGLEKSVTPRATWH
jgi:hypothetical protein